MVDGPIKFNETIDGNLNVENITKFGRNFSILKIPYAFKLLIQELQAMNIQMRIITEDNVDQLTNMGYSNNIVKMTNSEKDLKLTIVSEIMDRTDQKNKVLGKTDIIDSNDVLNEPIEYPVDKKVIEDRKSVV